MEKRIDDLLIDAAPPEKHKFKSPLILVHGPWSGSWCWRLWSTHFANLGWESWAINFRGRADPIHRHELARLTFEQCVEDLRTIVRSAPSPPIVLAHDLGGLIAQKAAEQEALSALVLAQSLSPAQEARPSRAARLLRLKYWLALLLGRPFRLEGNDFRRSYFSGLPESQHASVLSAMVPESAHIIRHWLRPTADVDPRRIRCPVLVIAGGRDPVASSASLSQLAKTLGADFFEYPGHGHWIMGEKGGEKIVADIHRWLLQKLGEPLLLATWRQE